jgi:hypothetical protein
VVVGLVEVEVVVPRSDLDLFPGPSSMLSTLPFHAEVVLGYIAVLIVLEAGKHP